MKKLLLTLLTALMLTGAAWAEWEKIAENDFAEYYIDRATIRKDGNLRRVWRLQDLKQRDKDGVLSRRFRAEYDCKQERDRILSFITHSEPMADGTILKLASMNNEWSDIPPNSIAEDVLKIVCAK
jgi:hypothetical protein